MQSNAAASVDTAKVASLAKRNPLLRAFLAHLASRRNEERITKVESILRLAATQPALGDIQRHEAVNMLKSLEATHCGRFIVGRRGQPSRFEWATSAIGLAGQLFPRGSVADQPQTDEGPEDGGRRDLGSVRFPLRWNYLVNFEVPDDMTTEERQRLSQFITTLPVKP